LADTTESSLLIAPQWIGDAVMTEPLVRLLAARGERVSVAALPWVAPVYQLMAGVGEVIALPFRGTLPAPSPLVAVIAYGAGMALFTIVMGNAFAAFPVITLGIGLPFVVQANGGNPAIMGALGMLAGYCGTLVTPMAANFNLVPTLLLDLEDKHAVIKAQVPMAAAIWSCPTEQMLAYPFQTFVRFCHNHGLLQIMNRPQWMTVAGGSRNYVSMLLDGIRSHGGQIKLETPVTGIKRSAEGVVVSSSEGHQAYDQMIMACHSDQALKILGEEASPHEKTFLGAIQYQANRAVLHTDTALLPINPKTWAAWNYGSPGGHEKQIGQRPVSVSYLLNKLQPLPTDTPVMVTLNPWHEPDPARTFRQIHYAHPVFDGPAIAAQDSLKKLSGFNRTFYAGAWMGYGFHEDGFASAVRAASQLAPLPDWILGPQPQLNQIALNMPMPATVNP